MAEYLKKPTGRALNELALNTAQSAIQRTGKALPCVVVGVVSSGIVTVAFQVNSGQFTLPNVTVPIAYPEYIRYPIQVGDLGMVAPADARIGQVSGLGGGLPDLTPPGNLSALRFVYLGSTKWTATDDPNSVVIYGPNGVIIRNKAGTIKVQVTTNSVQIVGNTAVTGNLTVTGNLGVNGSITALGDITAGTVSLKNHTHKGVTTGGGNTGTPN